MKFYTLDENENVVECGFMEHSLWFTKKGHFDLKTKLRYGRNELLVSTVFLGISHSGYFFETMIFGGPDEYQERYKTAVEAREGHKRTIKSIVSLN